MLNLNAVNGLRTKCFNRNGVTIMRAYAISNNSNEAIAELPAESGIYWYPLPFYFDYYYVNSLNDLVLRIDSSASKEIFDKFKGNIRLSDLYNYYDYTPGTNNELYKINLGITTKLKSMGLHTWDEFYNKQYVTENFIMINNAFDKIENEIVERQEEIESVDILSSVLDYATDNEVTKLADLGMAYRMTQYMRKVVDTKY